MRHHGFTLIELLVTIAVMAIIATIALPGFQSMMASNRVASDHNEILSGLNYARSEAIKRREHVTFKAEETAPWTYEVSAGNTVLRFRNGASHVIGVSGDLEISFNSRGRVESPACIGGCSITIHHASADDKTVNISRFGRVGRG